jgi:VWFA-related protein
MVPSTSRQPRPTRSSSPTTFGIYALCLGLPALVLIVCPLLESRVLAQNGTPVFRAGTELVRMDLSIADRLGRPVDDVRPDEIEITENGHRRPVILFRHLAERRDAADVSANLFNEVSENFLGATGHFFVLVFDQLHIAVGGEQRVREAADRFILRGLKHGDAVAVYGIPGPGPMLDLTTDLIKVRGGLREVHGKAARAAGVTDRPEPGPPAPQPGLLGGVPGAGGGLDAFAGSEVARARDSAAASRADAETHVFLSNLAEVMRRLQDIEGRKSVILFSQGFNAGALESQIEQLIYAAARSQTVVHVVDLSTATPRRGAPDRRDTLLRLAGETNGRVITDLANLDRALREIADQASDYYLVGFEPSASDTSAAYHPVQVKATRKGLVVRARSGYSIAPSQAPTPGHRAIDVALTVPRTFSALPVEYTTYEHVGPSPDKPRIITSVTAYVPQALCDRTGEVVFVVRDEATGRAVASGTDQLRLQGAPGDASAATLQPIRYSVQFEVPPGEYWMRVLVREPGGLIGTTDRRLHVWPLTGQGLATSDLIVASLHGARFDAPTKAEVHQGDEVLAYAEVYGTGDALRDANAQVEIGRADSGEIVATVDPLVKPGVLGKVVRARLPVEKLAEGRYFARLRLIAPNEAPKTLIRHFRVVAAAGAKPHTQP